VSLEGEGLLYLSRADVAAAAGEGPTLFVDAVTDAFALHARREVVQPLKPYLRWRPDGHIADRIIAMPAYVGGERPAAGLKWIGSKHDNPAQAGLERASALIVLNDPDTHRAVAVMEGALISAARTAAVTAVAVRHLARRGFSALTCVGCGPIGTHHVFTLLDQFPSIEVVWLYDLAESAGVALTENVVARHPKVDVRIAVDAESAVRAGDVIVTATLADRPWLPAAWLRPGSLLCNVSIMEVQPRREGHPPAHHRGQLLTPAAPRRARRDRDRRPAGPRERRRSHPPEPDGDGRRRRRLCESHR
jgi:ornithine cyclodeaminase